MVPQTLLGVVLFLILLGPGYIFVRRSEQITPTYSVSVFHETVRVVATSVACHAFSLLIFYVLRVSFPVVTPDVGAIIRDGASYLRAEYDFVGYYSFGLYVLSLAVAFTASHPAIQDSRFARLGWLVAVVGRGPIVGQSSWTKVFTDEADCPKRVACRLTDGSWIDGWLLTWNVQPEENDERSLVLTAPIRFRGPEGRTVKLIPGVQYSTISASQISRLDVIHVKKDDVSQFNDSYMQGQDS